MCNLKNFMFLFECRRLAYSCFNFQGKRSNPVFVFVFAVVFEAFIK